MNVYRQQTETESHSQAENNAQYHDKRHVFWMIGADGLECTPKTVADVHGRHNHGNDINENVERIFKGLRDDLIDGHIAFIHKVEVNQMHNDKGQ